MDENFLKIYDNLPKTIENKLHHIDPSVSAFIKLLTKVNDSNYLPIIDEMFNYYSGVISNLQKELLKMHENKQVIYIIPHDNNQSIVKNHQIELLNMEIKNKEL